MIILYYSRGTCEFLTDSHDGRLTFRPTNVTFYGWERGKHACVDLIDVFPLDGVRYRGFTIGHTTHD